MEKTFAEKLREWTLYEDAHPGNLRRVIREAADEIESLTAERNELKRRLDEEFANMDATMQGWEKLCADSERDALQIESLTDANGRLRAALEDAINECEFDYLRTRWRLVLNETGDK